jgi:hypothetical protein
MVVQQPSKTTAAHLKTEALFSNGFAFGKLFDERYQASLAPGSLPGTQ